MFSDRHWLDTRTEIQRATMTAWTNKVERLVIIEIGAGTDIPTVRILGETVSGRLIRINPREPDCHHKEAISIKLGGLEALKQIALAMNARSESPFVIPLQ